MNIKLNLVFNYDEEIKGYRCDNFEDYYIFDTGFGEFMIWSYEVYWDSMSREDGDSYSYEIEAFCETLETAKKYITNIALDKLHKLFSCIVVENASLVTKSVTQELGEITGYYEHQAHIKEYKKHIKQTIQTFTYIIQFKDKIKIGKSTHPNKRINTLELQTGERIIKRYIVQGDFEYELHKFFKPYRTLGEYFTGIAFEDIIGQYDNLNGGK